MRRDVSDGSIRQTVAQMGLSRINAILTRWIFRSMLAKRAYTRSELERLVVEAGFLPEHIEIAESLVGLEVRLRKSN